MGITDCTKTHISWLQTILLTSLTMWHHLVCEMYCVRYITQFTSVTQSCLTLCDPMDCSTTSFPVHHQLPEPTQTYVHCIGDAIQPSQSVIPFSSRLQSFSVSGSFPVSRYFASRGQSIGVLASATVLPMNTQD